MFIYNTGMRLAAWSFRLVWALGPLQRILSKRFPKATLFVIGQKGLTSAIREEMEGVRGEVCWFHAASYGEYNVIRPIVRRIKGKGLTAVVTFFSPSGYQAMKHENAKTGEADHVFYLPLDTPSQVRQFLDSVHPSKAIFAVSEYWINYLHELKNRGIPTFLVSMLVGGESYLLKWYARPIRRALAAIDTFMVLDEESKRNLSLIGFNNVEVTGDPLFDNAVGISKEPYRNAVIEKFCSTGEDVLVAGSISDGKDLALVAALANRHRDVKLLAAPHEISEETTRRITRAMEGKTLLYSACDEHTDFEGVQVLVIDFMGSLSRLYRYGRWAYVGGGFTPYLHSVVEPVVYGIPVSFGPRIERKRTARQMVGQGIGRIVKTEEEICEWFDSMRDEEKRTEVRVKARSYTERCSDGTNKVIQLLSK